MVDEAVVVGAGTMGAGIAQTLAQRDLWVTLVDVDEATLQRARRSIWSSAQRLADRGRITLTAEQILARIDLVVAQGGRIPKRPQATTGIEAVHEDSGLKRAVLAALQSSCAPDALLATNTSAIPIAELSSQLDDPSALIGLHFFNPPVLMQVVEVVRGPDSSDQAIALGLALVRRLGKDPLLVQHDIPGFVLNRIAIVASNEAMRLVQDGVATAEEIDRGVKGAFGWRMGPLETADLVGLDVVLAARMAIYQRTGDARFEPPRILRDLVDAGRLGRKSGGGFHDEPG
jgi:3-hydroxybutyryl-CoA dehydrogenase